MKSPQEMEREVDLITGQMIIYLSTIFVLIIMSIMIYYLFQMVV